MSRNVHPDGNRQGTSFSSQSTPNPRGWSTWADCDSDNVSGPRLPFRRAHYLCLVQLVPEVTDSCCLFLKMQVAFYVIPRFQGTEGDRCQKAVPARDPPKSPHYWADRRFSAVADPSNLSPFPLDWNWAKMGHVPVRSIPLSGLLVHNHGHTPESMTPTDAEEPGLTNQSYVDICPCPFFQLAAETDKLPIPILDSTYTVPSHNYWASGVASQIVLGDSDPWGPKPTWSDTHTATDMLERVILSHCTSTDTRPVSLRRGHHSGEGCQLRYWHRCNHSRFHPWKFALHIYQFLDFWRPRQFGLNCTVRNWDLFQNCGIVGRGLKWIETHGRGS